MLKEDQEEEVVDAAVEEDVAAAGVEAEKHPKIKCPNWQHTSFEGTSDDSDQLVFCFLKHMMLVMYLIHFFCIVNSAAFMKVK